MDAEGTNGQLILGKGFVEINRKGVLGFLTQGLKGSKKIAIKQITSIQFKPAGWTAGYIQFTVIGGQEHKGGVLTVGGDENSILFNKSQQSSFEKIKKAVEKQIYN